MMIRPNLIVDPNLELHLPLYQLDGGSFVSKDTRGSLCSVNGALWKPTGRVFDGIDDYIEVNDPLAAAGGSTSRTLIAWAKPSTTNFGASAGRVLTLHRTNIGNSTFAINAYGNPATWQYTYNITPTATILRDTGVVVSTTRLTFLALVQDGSDIRFHVDNAIITSSDGSAPAMSNPANAYVGAYYNGSVRDFYFAGIIAEAYVLSRAFSTLEVERLRLATKWRYQ